MTSSLNTSVKNIQHQSNHINKRHVFVFICACGSKQCGWLQKKHLMSFLQIVLPFYKQQQQKISSKNHGIINGWSLVHPAKETSMFEPLIYSVGLTLEQCVVVHSSIKQLASLLHCTRSLHNHPPLPTTPFHTPCTEMLVQIHCQHCNCENDLFSQSQPWPLSTTFEAWRVLSLQRSKKFNGKKEIHFVLNHKSLLNVQLILFHSQHVSNLYNIAFRIKLQNKAGKGTNWQEVH